jgi:hypothetical protein
MTVTRVARGNRRTRLGQREMRERFLPIDRPFDLPLPELNDGGVEKERQYEYMISMKNGMMVLASRVMRVVRGSKLFCA